jgi:hypothetical protein
MKKITSIFAIALFLFTVAACKTKTSDKLTFASAVEYNDFLVKQQKEVLNSQNTFSNAIDALDFSPNTDSNLTYKFREFAKAAKIALDTVNKLDSYNGNTQFRDDAIKMFQFWNDACKKEYKEMIALLLKGQELTPEDQDKMNKVGADVDAKESAFINTFLESQKKFATDNNMVLY